MLSYRHAFHAGNHADVLKHLCLLSCLDYLTRKDTALLYIDTHAGAGSYTLDSGYADQNREWAGGWQRLANLFEAAQENSVAPAVSRYGQAVTRYRESIGGNQYPGSPSLAVAALRPQDRAVFCELHPADYALLSDSNASDARVRALKQDGFAALRALLPPPSRRALVLCDPSYELASDYGRLAEALTDSLQRFATGSWLIWYPLLERAEAVMLPERLRTAAGQAKPLARSWLQAELLVRPRNPGERGMYGSGMFAINPPWPLRGELEAALPVLAGALAESDPGSGTQDTGTWRLESSES